MQLAEEHQAEELGGTQCQRISSHMGPLLLGNLLKGGCVLGKFFFFFRNRWWKMILFTRIWIDWTIQNRSFSVCLSSMIRYGHLISEV